MTSSKFKKSDQQTHDMTQFEGGHVDDLVGAVPGPDSVNRRISGPGTEPDWPPFPRLPSTSRPSIVLSRVS